MAMTYTSLKTDLINYTANTATQFSDLTGSFIELAESRIRRDLYVPEQLTHTTGNFADGTATYTLPADFVRFDTLHYETATANTYDPIELVPYAALQLFSPDRVTTSAVIKYFSRYSDTQFIVAPTPNATIAYRLSYIAKQPALATGVPTNWITDNAPDALLSAAMVEALRYQRNERGVAEWEGYYAAAAQRVNAETKVAEERDDQGGAAQLRNGRSI